MVDELSICDVTVVDVGIGNIASICNMVRRAGYRPGVARSSDDVVGASRLILPGVGRWDNAMTRLRDAGMDVALKDAVIRDRRPILGICLGMQILLESSDEGQLPGLGWIPGRNRRFDPPDSIQIKVPHMGWNIVHVVPNMLTRDLGEEPRYYFVHSYHAAEVPSESVIMTAHHGYDFACGINHQNIWGVQFHPEKSHKFGVQLFRNFLEA